MARAEPLITARAAGLVGCRRCTRVWPATTETCARCGEPLVSRDPRSLQRVWAWWIAGVIAYIPANLSPMLSTRTLTAHHEETIVGGVIELALHGSWEIALIILIASVAIPVGKFVAIAFLALSLGSTRFSEHGRHQLYHVVEFIGRWSMIDVFVVAILSALVQLGAVVSVNPGVAALTFALSVIFTMLSAQSFDPRLIYDAPEKARA